MRNITLNGTNVITIFEESINISSSLLVVSKMHSRIQNNIYVIISNCSYNTEANTALSKGSQKKTYESTHNAESFAAAVLLLS